MAEIKRIVCGTVNCYLAVGKDGAVLIDTGESGYEEKILKACKGENVRLVVLTHGHIDHIQNASYLSRELQVPIAMNEQDLELIRNQFAQNLEGTGIFGKALAAVSKRKMQKNKIEAFEPEVFLKEGDTLESFGVQAAVMELPGHTQGSIAIDVEGQALIAGDTLMHMLLPGIACIYEDRKKLRKSAGRITALGSRTIYFGHGAPAANRDWRLRK